VKRVEWWSAKVVSECRPGGMPTREIDLWEMFDTEREAQAFCKRNNFSGELDGDPFTVFKVTYESRPTGKP